MGSHSNSKYAEKVANLPVPVARWPRWIVSGGGFGLLRPAPGSWGTVPPALIYWAALCAGLHASHFLAFHAALLTAAAVAGIVLIRLGYWACCFYRRVDPGQVVLDEFAGFWIAAAFVPVPPWFAGDPLHLWYWTAIVFVLFRATDTLKIPPGRQLEGLPWGWGILLDDVAAGVQANFILQILVRVVFV